VAFAQKEYLVAQHHYVEALKLSLEGQFTPIMLDVLVGIAELLIQIQHQEMALDITTRLLQHPASSKDVQNRATLLLSTYEDNPLAHGDSGAGTNENNTELTIDKVANKILKFISAPLAAQPALSF
jgi:hypothetical protein